MVVKLFVLLICIDIVWNSVNYCEICPKHTLCKYTMPGPSATCKNYEMNLLCKNDIVKIINKINERRSFVAQGFAKQLPKAANMQKIRWSEELATFAQRWVDQCDQATFPDAEDECRDLADVKVGQNIASVTGPTPGLHIQSLIDVWYTIGLDYRGSVSYYNSSQDWKTNYFTQLIWGDTNRVGCGRARFYEGKKNTMIERLVCNFAPKGNNHGKPVYAIGFPATQCKEDMEPDQQYKGLCTHFTPKNVRKFTPINPPVSSLLRILNLSNNSAKQEIDPIGNNLRQVKSDRNETNEQRNQKTRHIFPNNSHGNSNIWGYPVNATRNQRIQQYQQERGHSRVYHGHDFHESKFSSEIPQTFTPNFRRFGYSNNADSITANHRRNQSNQCTRRNIQIPEAIHINNLCTCIPTTTCIPPPPRCQCNTNCQCLKTDCSPLLYSPGSRQHGDVKAGEASHTDLHYYDLLPKLAIRSGGSYNRRFQSKDSTTAPSRGIWLHSSRPGNTLKQFPRFNQDNNQENLKDFISYDSRNKPDFGYIYDSREREKRSRPDEITFKPFWQMDEFNNQKSGQLKSMKYTTLPKKKSKQLTTRMKFPQTTEIITVHLKQGSNAVQFHKNAVTEKYLSFDELMHLRKYGSTEVSTIMNARRSDNASSEYTTNTTFKRKKHCTRKLTCTWTAAEITDSNGSVIVGTGERGSRTPPGYVDGCTRTSTCTRVYMDRNKFSTIRDDDDSGSGVGEQQDEGDDRDYCEKRDIHRRDSNNEILYNVNSDISSTSSFLKSADVTMSYASSQMYKTSSSTENCLCLKYNQRIKRNEYKNYRFLNGDASLEGSKEKRSNKVTSYGNLYYLVLQKIIDTWQTQHGLNNVKSCICNDSSLLVKGSVILIMFMFSFNLLINYFR